MNQRYDALLQMYGEKVEEANELRLDLQDVKEMYKAQVILDGVQQGKLYNIVCRERSGKEWFWIISS